MSSVANEEKWVERLSGSGIDRDAALNELRLLILRGLSKSLKNAYACGLNLEDVAQDALIKILDSLETFEGRSKFLTWAMTIATRTGISALRHKRCKDISLEGITSADGLQFEIALDESLPVEKQLDRTRMLEKLGELIETSLTGKQKLAVRSILEGIPVEEFALRTNSNRNAVYKLVHDARLKLREGFEKVGVTAEDISAVLN